MSDSLKLFTSWEIMLMGQEDVADIFNSSVYSLSNLGIYFYKQPFILIPCLFF